jgi:hypothetical protein
MTTHNDDHHSNDEVSIVLQHFQPKPEYLIPQAASKKKRIGSFTSVIYKNDRSLRLVYLYKDGIIRLDFRISTVQPYAISYLNNANEIQQDEEGSLDSLCSKISAESRHSGSSLFSVVSRLLLSLDKLKLSEEAQCAAAFRSHVSRLTRHRQLSWDLPLVLMRCAATSRKSTKLCSPVPANFSNNPGAIVRIQDNLIIVPPAGGKEPDRREQSMVAFLASLPWTELAKLSTKSIPTPVANRKKIKVIIDLTNVSDATPRFSKLAEERGSITAFHGTTVDRVCIPACKRMVP